MTQATSGSPGFFGSCRATEPCEQPDCTLDEIGRPYDHNDRMRLKERDQFAEDEIDEGSMRKFPQPPPREEKARTKSCRICSAGAALDQCEETPRDRIDRNELEEELVHRSVFHNSPMATPVHPSVNGSQSRKSPVATPVHPSVDGSQSKKSLQFSEDGTSHRDNASFPSTSPNGKQGNMQTVLDRFGSFYDLAKDENAAGQELPAVQKNSADSTAQQHPEVQPLLGSSSGISFMPVDSPPDKGDKLHSYNDKVKEKEKDDEAHELHKNSLPVSGGEVKRASFSDEANELRSDGGSSNYSLEHQSQFFATHTSVWMGASLIGQLRNRLSSSKKEPET